MEEQKEKKIVESTIKLQEFLFKYKNLCRSLPKEITREQSKKLLISSARCLLLLRKHEEQVVKLIKSIDKEYFDNEHIQDLTMKNKIAEALLERLEAFEREEQ
jgi:hypothetical protein